MNATIIIGAGANKEINEGIDLGIELIKNIADRVTDRSSKNGPVLSSSISSHIPELTEEVRHTFLVHLDHYLATAESPSIDAFLDEINTYPEFINQRENFLMLGRIMIISHVLGYEGDATQEIVKKEINERKTWLSVLGDYLEEYGSRWLPHIITFNYDRILEFFLLERLGSTVVDFINSNIKHVYGRVGRLDQLKASIENEQVVPIGYTNNDFSKIKTWTHHIKLINERSQGARSLYLPSSQKVIAFGYGLDPINNRRLEFERLKFVDENFIFNIHSGHFPNYNFGQRRKMAEKVRAIKIDADIQYLTSCDFLRYALYKEYKRPPTVYLA